MSKIQVVSVLVFVGVTLLAIAILVAWDVFADWHWGEEGGTISESMQVLGERFPFFPFGIGLVMGLIIGSLAAHFWWPVGRKVDGTAIIREEIKLPGRSSQSK